MFSLSLFGNIEDDEIMSQCCFGSISPVFLNNLCYGLVEDNKIRTHTSLLCCFDVFKLKLYYWNVYWISHFEFFQTFRDDYTTLLIL